MLKGLITLLLVLMMVFLPEAQINPNPKRSPPVDPNFDVSKGVGRVKDDCKRRIRSTDNERARTLQSELEGES
jgi:hypothetical protein